MKKLRAGVVGCGWASILHQFGYMGNTDVVDVVACCDVIKERAEDRAKQYGAKKVYTDYEKMCQDPEIDLIDVTTTSPLHVARPARASAFQVSDSYQPRQVRTNYVVRGSDGRLWVVSESRSTWN